MSKVNRRRQRPGNPPSTSRPSGPTTPDPAGAAGGPSGAAAATPGAGTPRPVGSSGRPTSTGVRHGRRERSRVMYQPSFFERYRTAIVIVASLAGVALLSVFVFLSASQPAYACSTIWTPNPTPSPTAGATQQLGNVQPDMGRGHDPVGQKVTYTYCAPASGSHYNKPGVSGPIAAKVFSPSDNVIPEGWIHNLEHGALVVLYQGTGPGATAEGQAQLKAFYDAFPPGPVCGTPKGVVGPIIARFDQMSTPFQAIVWGRVLQLDTFDTAKILTFWNQWGERTNPEEQCPGRRSSASPSAAPASSASPASSAGPASSAAPSPS